MHKYLRAIGFSNINYKNQAEKIIDECVLHPDSSECYKYNPDASFHQYDKKLFDDVGITILGEWNDNKVPEYDRILPVLFGRGISTKEYIEVEALSDYEGYAGICEDPRVEISLIFHIQNVIQVKNALEEKKIGEITTTFSGLSLGGKVLLPVTKNKGQIETRKKIAATRNNLVAQARKGDEKAIEILTLSDIDTYTDIAKRIVKEDVFSLVDSFFMPYGIESDKYSILGEIVECYELVNPISREKLYKLRINCNDLEIDICMNQEDLLGEPAVGRRFKGNIWLQGRINL